ncbi:thiamine pyrophosphate-binding protein [Yoonia sediminilitoris]|uniref:Acetolactate synthase-1/2/3 large subunit n=1 Tax=Yoonia sediminilitoris TaxID=1286148 RepID=A0A2T6KIC6_9RHOB|nr:thiamine pyrophosphate-binding protein [Yoonia sediminilitoris]PUB15411.1 acetolactate synthase-1/2/3 large subunit [Yoonia sediminilitoris]RCW96021.1 acetolactate synthase-1/2/3 large subunit [Yoonia sediminilitoris]
MIRHGGKILSDQLVKLGVRRVYSVPGESFLAALDGLYDSGIQNVVCRQEGGAAMMAEAHGKMTGTPGVCFVTRGPGACNASAGVHVAMQDSTPMVLFVGQIDNRQTDRETFQEVDYRAMFGGLAKWVAQVDHTDRLPEYIARAFRVAMSGRPGPVVLALPENMLSATADVPDFACGTTLAPATLPAAFSKVFGRLMASEKPLLVVGGPHWTDKAARSLAQFAEMTGVPVVSSFRRQDYIDNRQVHFAGDLNVGVNPKLAQRVREADCLLLLGTRFGDIATQGYSLVDPANPGKTILHIHADANEIGRVYGADEAVTCDGASAIHMMCDLAGASDVTPQWERWRTQARADYEGWIIPQESPGACKQEQVIKWLSDNLPEDAIVTNGAGNYAAWLHRYFVYQQYGTQLAPTSGSMGYGIPAAISASLEHPDRQVVCLAGDGCFQMTCNELSTAAQHGATPIIVVMNNGRYGTIRMHQEKTYPARVSGTALANPDFAALARAYGGHGEVVTETGQFAKAFGRAQASGTFAIIECKIDEEALATGATLTAVREAALAK